MGKETLIKVNHLVKQFNNETAIKDVSFQVNSGEIFGFLGPSGAGKTTTIKILTGQLIKTDGSALIFDRDVGKIDSEIYQQMGIVTHNSGVYEKMTVYDNLLFFAKILKVDTKRIDELLKRVGLFEQKKKMAGKLSQGMKQRLILARAILHEPKLLFLDEPTNGLDPSTSEAIHELLLELREAGTGIFLTTHNMQEATNLCDKVALLNDGVIEELGSPRDLSLKYNTNQKYSISLKNGVSLTLPQSVETAKQIFEWIDNDQLQTIHSNEPTLEQVFLDVTGRELL